MKKKIISCILAFTLFTLPVCAGAAGVRETEIGSRNFGTFEYKDNSGITKVKINADDIKTVAGYVDTAESHVSSIESRMDQIYDPDGNGGAGSGTLTDIEEQVDAISDAVSLSSSEAASTTDVLTGKKYITKGADGKLTVETGTMASYKNTSSAVNTTSPSNATESGSIGDSGFTATAAVTLPAGYYDGSTPINVTDLVTHYYNEGKANSTPDMTGQNLGDITDWNNFHGKAYVGTFSSSTTISLSYLPGYRNLTNDNFYYELVNGSCSASNTYSKDTGYAHSISGTGTFTTPSISYVSSTGQLSITAATLTASGSCAGLSVPSSKVLDTTIYLIK